MSNHREALAGFLARNRMTNRHLAYYLDMDQKRVNLLVKQDDLPRHKRLALDWALRHGPEKERLRAEQIQHLNLDRLIALTGLQPRYVAALQAGELPMSKWASLAFRGAARRMGFKDL